MSTYLRITVPVAITDAMVTDTDVPEADYAAWAGGTTYALGDRCIKGHKIWESAQAGNTGHDPETSGSAWWLKVSATNRWRLFDLEQVTSTSKASGMYYELQPGSPINSVHMLGLYDVYSVQLRVYDGATLAYDGGQNASGLLPTESDWWAYCYGPWTLSDQQHYADLPYIVAPKIRVDYTGGAAMSTQVLMLGNDTLFGTQSATGVQAGVRIRFDRSSSFKPNEFDIPTMKTSALVATVNFTLILLSSDVDTLLDFYRDNGAQVCLFTVSDLWRATQILGVITSLEPMLHGPVYSEFAFEIRGVPQQ